MNMQSLSDRLWLLFSMIGFYQLPMAAAHAAQQWKPSRGVIIRPSRWSIDIDRICLYASSDVNMFISSSLFRPFSPFYRHFFSPVFYFSYRPWLVCGANGGEYIILFLLSFFLSSLLWLFGLCIPEAVWGGSLYVQSTTSGTERFEEDFGAFVKVSRVFVIVIYHISSLYFLILL